MNPDTIIGHLDQAFSHLRDGILWKDYKNHAEAVQIAIDDLAYAILRYGIHAQDCATIQGLGSVCTCGYQKLVDYLAGAFNESGLNVPSGPLAPALPLKPLQAYKSAANQVDVQDIVLRNPPDSHMSIITDVGRYRVKADLVDGVLRIEAE